MSSFGSCQTRFEFLSQFRKVRNAFGVFRSTGANAFAKNQTRLAYEDKRDLCCIHAYVVIPAVIGINASTVDYYFKHITTFNNVSRHIAISVLQMLGQITFLVTGRSAFSHILVSIPMSMGFIWNRNGVLFKFVCTCSLMHRCELLSIN